VNFRSGRRDRITLKARFDRLGPAERGSRSEQRLSVSDSHTLLTAVREAELRYALERLIMAGLLFRQRVPPHGAGKHAFLLMF